MALSFYSSAARNFVVGELNWPADVFHLMLMTSSYTFNAAHDFRSDIANEVSGDGYTAGGLPLENLTASAANPCVLSADDVNIAQSASGFSNGRKYAFVEIKGGAASADPLLNYGTAAADFGNVASPLVIDVPSSLITVSV